MPLSRTDYQGLSSFNDLDEPAAFELLRSCCDSVDWAQALMQARPFRTVDQFSIRVRAELLALSEPDVDRALATLAPSGPGRDDDRRARLTGASLVALGSALGRMSGSAGPGTGLISLQVRDTDTGGPAVGLPVRLEDTAGAIHGAAVTDGFGCVPAGRLRVTEPGLYRLILRVAGYFPIPEPVCPELTIGIPVNSPGRDRHVPVTLSRNDFPDVSTN